MLSSGSAMVRLCILFTLQGGGHILVSLVAAEAAVYRKNRRPESVAVVESFVRQRAQGLLPDKYGSPCAPGARSESAATTTMEEERDEARTIGHPGPWPGM